MELTNESFLLLLDKIDRHTHEDGINMSYRMDEDVFERRLVFNFEKNGINRCISFDMRIVYVTMDIDQLWRSIMDEIEVLKNMIETGGNNK